MLKFDENGYLKPAKRIETTLDEFRQFFVDAFPKSNTRQRLFENYMDWIFDFQREIFPYFTHWIDGSFVTQKQHPKDIDFVTFLPDVYHLKEKSKSLDKFWTFSTEHLGLDGYILPDYEPEDARIETLQKLKTDWDNRYILGRKIDNDFYRPKGYLQIKFLKSW